MLKSNGVGGRIRTCLPRLVQRCNSDTGSTRVLLRLVCRVELVPGGLAWPWTLAPHLQNKTEISLFQSWLIFFVCHSCTLFFSVILFLRRARQRDVISWRVQMSLLNWILLFWKPPVLPELARVGHLSNMKSLHISLNMAHLYKAEDITSSEFFNPPGFNWPLF